MSGSPLYSVAQPALPSAHTCDLCGLPLRFGEFRLTLACGQRRFCCRGCQQVFAMLAEAADMGPENLFQDTELFKRCREMGIVPASEADLARFQTQAPAGSEGTAGDPVRKDGGERTDAGSDAHCLDLVLNISGMWCPACAWVVQEALHKLAGITTANCNFATDRLHCRYTPTVCTPADIVSTVAQLGYAASEPSRSRHARERRIEFIRFAVTAFLSMNVMMLSFALYSGFFTPLEADAIGKLSWPIFGLTSAVLFYGGIHIHRKAWSGLVAGNPGMETLVSLGAVCTYLFSTWNMIAGTIHLYFDTSAMLITLVLLGKLLERRAKEGVQTELDNFFLHLPQKVRICNAPYPRGRWTDAAALRPGDVFRAQPGEVLPADGIVVAGRGSVDESSLTGEARPIVKTIDQSMTSGARVVDGSFRIKALAVGADATWGRMMAVMQRALDQKTPLEGRTDRLLRGFVPVILLLSAGTVAACALTGLGSDEALLRAVTVLVIACPCALGIAIPLVRVAGISVAGRQGILVQDFAAFEQTEILNVAVFDKTGTLTRGDWRLQQVTALKPFTYAQVVAAAAGLEKDSLHPIGRQIRQCAGKEKITPRPMDRVELHPNGLTGRSGSNRFQIGSRPFLKTVFPSPTAAHPSDNRLCSSVFLSIDNRPAAIFQFGDRLRSESLQTVEYLRKRGLDLILVSGDDQTVTAAVARQVGIPVAHGQKMPAQKAELIVDLQRRKHRVAMVGDGVNDAPALVQADLGVAVHAGDYLQHTAAAVTLMRGNPLQMADFLELADRVNRKIDQNLVCAFLYNFISVPLAMAGLLTPLVAVCAMLISSLSVIGNTLRLMRQKPRPISAPSPGPESGSPPGEHPGPDHHPKS